MWTPIFAALTFAQLLGFEQALALAPSTPAVERERSSHEQREAEASGMRRLVDNPVLQVQPGYREIASGGAGAELYAGLSQRVRLTQYGQKRKAAVARELAQDVAAASRALRDARHAIARAWIARWSAQQMHTTAQGEVGLARQLLRSTQTALAAGEATRVDVAQIETWLAESSLLALQAEGMTFERGLELSRVVGSPTGEPIAASEELPALDLPAQGALPSRLARADTTPRVREARALHAAEQARLNEARASRGTELNVGALAWREGTGDLAAVATLELTLPVVERAKRESASAAAQVARAEQDAQQATLEAEVDRSRMIHEVEHTERLLAATEGGLLRAAESLADAQEKRFLAREATSQDWVLARRAVLRARTETANARAAVLLARFRAREALAPAGAR
jgi:cobalt-zinc-cadmium efflux system outer membrane protein